jgi:hypothetical protein
METAAIPARSVADAAPFPLREMEDLHDADFDGVLAERLLDAGPAEASARTLADVVSRPGAASAHVLGARAVLLALY